MAQRRHIGASTGTSSSIRSSSHSSSTRRLALQAQWRTNSPGIHPHFMTKTVCKLTCRFCQSDVCHRGMRAILLADTSVELFSTDLPPLGRVQLVNDEYATKNCSCRIRDVACLCCGMVLGYHVTKPCPPCLESWNNGHFWMFHSSCIEAAARKTGPDGGAMLWGALPPTDDSDDIDMESSPFLSIECVR